MLRSSTAAGWRERASVLVHLAVAIALGAVNLSEAEQLQLHHRPLFGPAASVSTARRTLAVLDEAVLAKIAKARARGRRHVWSLLHLRPGGFPWLMVAGKRLTGWIDIDLDATIITAASKKTGAAVTLKFPHTQTAPAPAGDRRCQQTNRGRPGGRPLEGTGF